MKRKKGDEIDRRTFLKEMGIGAAALAHAPGHAQALARSSREPLPLPPSVSACKDRGVYRGEHLRAVSMPLGGIGTGIIALAGDGGLRHWQVVHNADHLAHVPDSFFALCVKPESGPPVARILQSAQNYGEPNFKLPVTSTDYVVPSESRRLLETLPGVKELEFSGEYPLAEIRYIDESFGPLVRLEAYAPFEPLNAKDSGLPCIVFEFHLKNPEPRAVTASVMATLQNFVGWAGWGTFEQKTSSTSQVNSLIVRSGMVNLRTLGFQIQAGAALASAELNSEPLPLESRFSDGAAHLVSDEGFTIHTGSFLEVRIS